MPLTTCPKDRCKLKTWGKGKVHKLISSGAGLLFKGSGFYITDYRSENYKSGAKKESGAKDGKESTSSSTGSETKPAASTEKKAAAKPEAKPAKAPKQNS